MKIIEINKCSDCNGRARVGYYKSKRGKISRTFTGVSGGISYILKVNDKDYLRKKGKSFTIWCRECPKCKGTGETKKVTIKNKVKAIKIYDTEIKSWEIIK